MELGEKTVSISVGTIVKAIVVVLLFIVLFVLKDLVLVLLLSIVVASAVEPGAQWFVRRGLPRLFSVILIYIVIAICVIGILFFLLLPLLSESTDFLRNFPSYFNTSNITNIISNNNFLSSQPFVAGITDRLNLDSIILQINNIIGGITSNTFSAVAAVFGGILNFFLTIILSFYLAVDEDGVGKFLKSISPIKHEKYITALWKRSQKKIGLWMQGQLVLSIIIGMLVYLGLLIINVPNALLLAALAAAFEIIPLFGPILASIPAIIIAFATGNITTALIVAGLYIIVHQFENQLIYPLVVKKVVGVSPVVSIIALAAGWQLAGFVGLVLAVPISAVITEFMSDFEKDKIERTERMLNK